MEKNYNTIKGNLLLSLVILISLVGIIAWESGELLFARFSLLYIPMAPSTALSFFVLGSSLFLFLKFKQNKKIKILAYTFTGLFLLMNCIILARFFFNFNWDIETLFIKNPTQFNNVPIGRMSPLTAGLFLTNGLSILILNSPLYRSRLSKNMYGLLTLIGLFISSLLLIGYLYNNPLLYGMDIIPVALPTAICFWLLNLTLFLFIDIKSLLFLPNISTFEKKLSKIFIPFVLILVILFGYINTAFLPNFQNPTYLSAFILIIIIPLTVLLIFFISRSIGKSIEKAEKSAIDSEHKFQELFKHMNEGFALHEIILDKKGKPSDYKFLEVNSAFAKFSGLDINNIIGKTVRQIWPGIENDSANWLEKYGEVALTGKELSMDDYSETLGKWVRINAFSPKKGQFAVTFSENTKWKLAEQRLKQSEKQYRNLFENLNEGFALHQIIVDETGKAIDYQFLDVNEAFSRLTGLTKELVIGKTARQTMPGIENDPENWIQKYGEVALTGKDINFEAHFSPIEKWFSIHAFKVLEGQFGVVFSDITKEKEATLLLKESEMLLKMTGSVAKIGGWSINLATQTLSWTEEVYHIHEHPLDKLPEVKDVINFYHPDDKSVISEAVKNAIENSIPFDLELRITTSKNNVKWVHSVGHVAQVHGENEIINGTIQDITERKLAEEELKRNHEQLEFRVKERTSEIESKNIEMDNLKVALLNIVEDLNEKSVLLEESTEDLENSNKELKAFSYSVSHDLKAPLRAVSGFTQILNEDYGAELPQEAKRYLGLIHENAENMGLLINDLLSFSRLGGKDLQISQVNMHDIIPRIKNELKTEFKDRKLSFKVLPMPLINADESLMYHVMINLISNAVKFTSKVEKAKIEIGCEIINKKNVYYIKDNGIGFDMKYADKIFNVFQRLHGGDEFPGTGIGLSIVQRIIYKHYGKIWVESEKNKGTTFFFTI